MLLIEDPSELEEQVWMVVVSGWLEGVGREISCPERFVACDISCDTRPMLMLEDVLLAGR